MLVLLGAICASPSSAGQIEQSQVVLDQFPTNLLANPAPTLSPDGRHLYVSGRDDDALTVFARQPVTGALSQTQQLQNGFGGVSDMDSPLRLDVSPDGRHLYVPARGLGNAGTLVVFSRNANGGALAFVESHVDGVAGVEGLGSANQAQVSPDGAHVYVAAPADKAIAIFSRNATTGRLTYLGFVGLGVSGFQTLGTVTMLRFDSSGRFLYAGAPTESSLSALGRDPATGSLQLIDTESVFAPHDLALSRDGRHLYVSGGSGLSRLSRDIATGSLNFVDTLPGTDSMGASDVLISPDDRLVFHAFFQQSKLSVYSRDVPTGALTEIDVRTNGMDGVESLGAPTWMTIDRDGRHLYVVAHNGSSPDAISLFSTAALDFAGLTRDGVDGVSSFSEPVDVAWSPDGRHAYATGSASNALVAFAFDAGTHQLAFVDAEVDGLAGVDGLATSAGVAVSPDGRHVYATGFSDDAVATFSRNASSGVLLFVERDRDGIGGVTGLDGAIAVASSPDGAHVYTAALEGDAVAAFSRDGASGALTFVGSLQDGLAGVDGLDGAAAVAVSPDGAHVYVASFFDDSIAIFSRSPATGALTFLDLVRDGIGGVSGLDGPYDVVVTPDGAHLYAAGTAGFVPRFSRDAETGLLTFLGAVANGVGGVRGLVLPLGIASDLLGRYIALANSSADSIALFSRDPDSGDLSFVQVEFDGVGGVDGLDSATSLAFSPSGRHLLATGRMTDDALVLFAPEAGAKLASLAALTALLFARARTS